MASISKALSWAEERCENKLVGYSMDFRTGKAVSYSTAKGYHEYASNYKYDFDYVGHSKKITYYDCSSFVYYALKAGGFKGLPSYPFTTTSMPSYFTNHNWKKVATSKLKRGDVGLSNSHTEMCYKGGAMGTSAIFMGAHGRNSSGVAKWFPGQVSIGTNSGTTKSGYDKNGHINSFTKAYRYKGSDDDPDSSYEPDEEYSNVPSYEVIAAIAGNFWQESSINPGEWESLQQCAYDYVYGDDGPNKGGFGLFQWTNTDGDKHGRLWKLYQWMKKGGYAMDDGDAQCNYLFLHESSSDTWIANGLWGNYSSDFPDLDSFVHSDITDLSKLCDAWMHCAERCGDSSLNKRISYAETCLDYIKKHKDDESITSWIAANKYISEANTLNNAVMLLRSMYNIYADGSYHIDNAAPENEDDGVGLDDFLLAMLARQAENQSHLHIHKGLWRV